jgi:hypothetical protein
MTQVIKNETNLSECPCDKCPSYNECAKAKSEKLYCAAEVGRSTCEYKMNGCICGTCQIHKDSKLTSGYYCLNGSAEEIG